MIQINDSRESFKLVQLNALKVKEWVKYSQYTKGLQIDFNW